MFKRVSLVIASILVACTAFIACDKKADTAANNQPAAAAADAAAPAAAPAADAAAPAADPAAAAAPAAAPDGQLPPPPMPPVGAAPLPPVPPEAQAAVDNLLSVMSSIADAGKKETCAEVLADLKKLEADPSIKDKLISTKILQNYPEDIQKSINQANQQRLFGVAIEMAAFQKCQDAPENNDIDASIKAILAPIAPEEDAAAAPAADAAAAAPAAAPAADAAPAAAAPAADAAPAAAAPAADAAPAAAAPAADAAAAAPAAN